MARSNAKGTRGELSWAERVNGKKLSRRGYEGADVASPPWTIEPMSIWEVKLRAEFPGWLEDWMTQVIAEGAHGLAMRRNYGEWWLLIPASRLVKPDNISPTSDTFLLDDLRGTIQMMRKQLELAEARLEKAVSNAP